MIAFCFLFLVLNANSRVDWSVFQYYSSTSPTDRGLHGTINLIIRASGQTTLPILNENEAVNLWLKIILDIE